MAVTVLRALGLGDLLIAVPALRAIARSFPEQRRILASPAWLESLLPLIREGGEPCVHGIAAIGGLDGDPRRLPHRPSLAINLHGRGPESHRLLLATEPQRLIAFRNDAVAVTAALPRWDPSEHERRRWCGLLEHFGIAADPSELDIGQPEVELPQWAYGATLLHPGAASAARRWPPERWMAIARHERSQGRQVLITGSGEEIGLARRIAAEAGLDPRHEIAGRTDAGTLAAFVAAAAVVVCGDTGVAHLATALSVPSVLLFGPTSPRLWGPPQERAIHRVLWHGGSGDPHAEQVDPRLLEIEAEEVLAELESLRPALVA